MLQDFQQPGRDHRPIPFWSWNEDLKPEELRRQIEEMGKAGLGGYFMHARSGLKLDYLGEDWFSCIETGIQKGKELGLHAWIYDEEGWPSGFAGGIVTDMSPAYHAKFMVLEEYDDWAALEEDQMLAVYLLHRDNSFEPVEKNTAICKEGEKLLAVRRKTQRYYIDVMSHEAVDAFLSVTHQRYYEKYGEHFGETMQGFFTDEPRFTCNKFGELAWSDTMPEEFMLRYEYSILDVLPLLWRAYPGYEKVRYDYWRAANDLFVTNYMKNIYDWCEKHSCKVTGHIMMEESIFGQMTSTGGVMPFYEYEHIPGIDWLRRRIESPVIGKQVGSVACQLGKKQVLTESFALAGWNVSFEELKWIMEWQYVNGVNLLCQHLEAYSLKGSRKRDYPPSLFLQQSWWDEYKSFNDYVARLGVVLSAGNQTADALLLHPMRSGYICFDGTRTEKIRTLDAKFTEISKVLSSEHISYHYGDETIISKYGRIQDQEFVVGEIGYKTVILPHMYAIDQCTLMLLHEFLDHGGIVFSVGDFPLYTNGSEEALRRLKERIMSVSYEEILPHMHKAGLVSVSISCDSRQAESISYQQRETEEGTILFLVNHSQTKSYDTEICMYEKTASVDRLYAEDGSIGPLSYDAKTDTRLRLYFEPMQSYILLLRDIRTSPQSDPNQEEIQIELPIEWDIKRMGRNAFTLDLCTYRIDEGDREGPIPAIRLMKKLLDLKRPCKMEMGYEFFVDMDLTKNKELFIAMEDAEVYKIFVNGQEITHKPNGWWKDRSFHRIDIKAYVKNGKNEIILRGIFAQNQKVYDTLYGEGVYETALNKLTYDMEIESIYLVGDFGVISRSSAKKAPKNAFFHKGPFVITDQPSHFTHHDFADQGLLFFAEDLVVTQRIHIHKEKGKKIMLHYGNHNAPMIKIYLNGTIVKKSLWAPYQADITEVAVEGENLLEIQLFASNRNLLGPHHHIHGECYNVGPSSFTGEWSWVERESEAEATDIADRTKDYWNDAYCFVEFGFGKSL